MWKQNLKLDDQVNLWSIFYFKNLSQKNKF
jgi:hypothetical protein